MFKEFIRVFAYREMLSNSVRKELRARYKGSVLGFLWTFVNPLLQLLIYSLVFNKILGVQPVGDVNFSIILFVALVPWNCVSATIQQSTNVILANASLIKKVYFPRLILPLSLTLTNVVNMLLTFIIVFIVVLAGGCTPSLAYLALPIMVFEVLLLCYSVSVFLSGITVYFRDLEHIIAVFVQLWFYLTPIVYPADLVLGKSMPQLMVKLYQLNPAYGIVEGFRDIFIYGKFPDIGLILSTCSISLVILVVALAVFNRCQRRFAEEI